MARQRDRVNADWDTPTDGFTWSHVQIELLMDIRDELRLLNSVFRCTNFLSIPDTLRDVRTKLTTISRKIPVQKPRRRA